MPMKQVHEYSQSADKFEAEPEGVCQALSAHWIVSRALWDPKRDGRWAEGRWMGSKRDMEPHVWRTYRATRAARAAVTSEERAAMEQAIKRFDEKQQHGGLDGSLHLDRNVSVDRASLNVCTLGKGYNLIDVRDSSLTDEGGAHAIAAEIRESETRLFDPNYGEWASVPPGNPSSSFGSLLNFLLQSIYRLGSVQYLSVIHFPLKAGQS